ncbi:Zn(2+)-responsive transcriptional regulator [Glaciecola sp. SC05]|uniref:Zn(2+)-responsive transcriptional regulator n=1 Tax=Glaciecola sp. SC05 TaxID=1987355 RepID=UPI00352805B9
MKTKNRYKIGELAKLTGMTVEAIRFYESKNLIQASDRLPSGYRIFNAHELDKLWFVRRAKAVGFSLDEISELLELRLHPNDHSCQEVKQVTADKMAQIQEKIDELQSIHSSLNTLHQACCGGPESAEHCTILQILNSEAKL